MKLRNGLLAVLFIFIVFSMSVPQVEASTGKVASDYYIEDATLDGNKVFLVGAKFNEDGTHSEEFEVVVKEGETTRTIIPSSDLDGLIKVLGQTTDHLYLYSIEDYNTFDRHIKHMYIVNKRTYTYEKKTGQDVLSSILPFLHSKGYEVSAANLKLLEKGLYFNYDGILWYQVALNGKTLLVHKNGTVVERKGEVSYPDTTVDTKGNLYYTKRVETKPYSLNHYQLVKVQPNGQETVYDFYDAKSQWYGLMVDAKGHIYLHFWDGTFYDAGWNVYAIENDKLAYKRSFQQTYTEMKQDTDGNIWYRKGYPYKAGYISKGLQEQDTYQSEDFVFSSYFKNNALYFDRDSYHLVNRTGWALENGNWFYYKGAMGKSIGWLKDKEKWYYLDSNGVMQTGFYYVEDERKHYYLNGSGAMQTGWVYAKKNGVSSWYYMNPDGSVKSGWFKQGASWYYLNPAWNQFGALTQGWIHDGSAWYYQGNYGMRTGWIHDGTGWYFLKGSGAMQTGWLYHNHNWYYLAKSGKMATGWQAINHKWYYFYPNGDMAANTTINGYKLGADGAWK